MKSKTKALVIAGVMPRCPAKGWHKAKEFRLRFVFAGRGNVA